MKLIVIYCKSSFIHSLNKCNDQRLSICQRPIWMWWHPGLDAQQLPIERHILQMKAVAERGLHLPPACDLRAEGLMQQFCKASGGCMVCHGHISTFGYVWMAAWHIYKEVGKKGTCMTCIHDLGPKEAGPLIPSTVRTVWWVKDVA